MIRYYRLLVLQLVHLKLLDISELEIAFKFCQDFILGLSIPMKVQNSAVQGKFFIVNLEKIEAESPILLQTYPPLPYSPQLLKVFYFHEIKIQIY